MPSVPRRLQPLMLEIDSSRGGERVEWLLRAVFEDEITVQLSSYDAEQGDYSEESPTAILLKRLADWMEREYIAIPVGVYEVNHTGKA